MGNPNHHHLLLLLLLLPLIMAIMAGVPAASSTPSPSPPCDYRKQKCGNTSIPYPFGMNDHCGLPDYRISCRENSRLGTGPLPFLRVNRTVEFQVLNFSAGSLIINATDFKADSCDFSSPGHAALALPDQAPFIVSSENIFTAVGCDSTGNFTTSHNTSSPVYEGGCTNPCYNSYPYRFCNNYACCTVGLEQDGAKTIEIRGAGIAYRDFPGVCGFSMVLDPDTYVPTAPGVFGAGHYGIKLSWGIPLSDESQNCLTVKTTTGYACAALSDCLDVGNLPGYVCNCSRQGYQGDGYRDGTGCENINECVHERLNNCAGPPYGICTDGPGSFNCNCIDGAVGDGISVTSGGTGCTKVEKHAQTDTIVTGTALSTAAAIGITGLLVWWIYKSRTTRVRKAKYFEKNGGIRLKEYISATRGRETPRLFFEAELRKATQNFAAHLELGRGGYGTVYKGILADATVVAIKKSNHTEQHEVDQFVNEVIILSQINHRNIVQLLGSCLETPVPLLVYEYISNGTLSEHLQGKDGRFLSWENRLSIALESAQALAYLHSSVSTPIFHRDIKSSNILLDKALTPKVSDFGISRLLPMDQTHVSTVVQGTMGYLDPEYFQTFQLTDKSDVYSFGIVLLELITSLRPVAMERGETESNLAMLCISRWRTGTFSTLIDPGLRASQNPRMMRSINQVAKLAINCLHVAGHKRPTMKEVFEELLWIRGSKESMVADVHSSQGMDEDEIEALIPTSQKLSDNPSYNFTDASSSNPSGLQALEMVMRESLTGGR